MRQQLVHKEHLPGTFPRLAAVDLRGDCSFRHKRLKNRVFFDQSKSLVSKGLKVKRNRRANVQQGLLVGITLADDGSASETERVGDISIGVSFHDNLQRSGHAGP